MRTGISVEQLALQLHCFLLHRTRIAGTSGTKEGNTKAIEVYGEVGSMRVGIGVEQLASERHRFLICGTCIAVTSSRVEGIAEIVEST